MRGAGRQRQARGKQRISETREGAVPIPHFVWPTRHGPYCTACRAISLHVALETLKAAAEEGHLANENAVSGG